LMTALLFLVIRRGPVAAALECRGACQRELLPWDDGVDDGRLSGGVP
jgi:hypothetical protein